MADDRWTTSNSAYGAFWKAVPLEPKVVAQPPPNDAAAAARDREENPSRERLARLLRRHGVKERDVAGDGNCQFRALSDQLYGSEDHHASVRQLVVAQLTKEPDRYTGFVPGRFRDYVGGMARDGTWGDHVTLQAAADALGVEIHVLTDFLTDGYLEVVPKERKSQRVLRISFWAEVHYNSVAK
mmetsp:Transcript_115309/g.330981  ORF Transcript_115309/g.330981 Transcript_115309/m.330981 type:complete len:184 (-) Transcript_115309:95-646(-)